jgi:hypothetical protein
MKLRLLTALLCAGAVAAGTLGVVVAASGASPTSGMVATRRLTETQYRHTIADVFGGDIVVNGRFEPERREELLLAVGAGELSISGAGFDQYYAMAKTISDQVFDEKHRARVTSCKPADPAKVDEKCVETFLRTYGLKLFRRPLTDAEIKSRVTMAVKSGTASKSHYTGMRLALTSLLISPEYLFRIETAANDGKGGKRLDGYSRASRLSYLLWDTAPDDELLRAAAAGELYTRVGLEKQAARLVASPKAEAGTRAFFTDMLQLDYFETVTKDVTVFPKFSAALMDSAKEQTLKTLIDQLVTKKGDYRDIFTSRETFINRQLASAYQAPFVSATDWTRYSIPQDQESAGIVTQVTFLSLFSHPGRSSPTKRGVALNEVFLCTPTPAPPANVDFSIVNNTNDPSLKTVRDRLLAHANDETCAACHNQSDPLGLSLEHFDSLGQHRETENGAKIDVAAELDGRRFSGATGLGRLLHDNPRAPKCLVRNVYAYGAGRAPDANDAKYLAEQTAAFAQDGYRLQSLLTRVAVSDEFYRVPPPKPVAPLKVASAQPLRQTGGQP